MRAVSSASWPLMNCEAEPHLNSAVFEGSSVKGKCAEGPMRGMIDSDGGGTPRGKECDVEAKEACGLLGSPPGEKG